MELFQPSMLPPGGVHVPSKTLFLQITDSDSITCGFSYANVSAIFYDVSLEAYKI